MNFIGPALPLSDGDVKTIAGYLGCQIATVRAVLEVEAANSGFDNKGRPKMLFESHVFYRELGRGAKRTEAVKAGLARKSWVRDYPADSYPRLLAAMAIDETAALRSASFGLGQVMGFNHKAAGFNTVQDFVEAMTISEGAHLYAMARFIVTNGLQRHLRNLDWAGFARGYNGPGYARNRYDEKMRKAYQSRPAKEKVTPDPASMEALNALIAAPKPAGEQKPTPTPTPRPDAEPARKPGGKSAIAAIIFAIIAAGAAIIAKLTGG